MADEAGAVATVAEQAVEPVEEHGGHPDVKQYVMIAVVLVIVTALEIATSYVDTGHTNWIIIALGAMAIVKFILVTGWYMHMKSDHPLFRRFFIVGHHRRVRRVRHRVRGVLEQRAEVIGRNAWSAMSPSPRGRPTPTCGC